MALDDVEVVRGAAVPVGSGQCSTDRLRLSPGGRPDQRCRGRSRQGCASLKRSGSDQGRTVSQRWQDEPVKVGARQLRPQQGASVAGKSLLWRVVDNFRGSTGLGKSIHQCGQPRMAARKRNDMSAGAAVRRVLTVAVHPEAASTPKPKPKPNSKPKPKPKVKERANPKAFAQAALAIPMFGYENHICIDWAHGPIRELERQHCQQQRWRKAAGVDRPRQQGSGCVAWNHRLPKRGRGLPRRRHAH